MTHVIQCTNVNVLLPHVENVHNMLNRMSHCGPFGRMSLQENTTFVVQLVHHKLKKKAPTAKELTKLPRHHSVSLLRALLLNPGQFGCA